MSLHITISLAHIWRNNIRVEGKFSTPLFQTKSPLGTIITTFKTLCFMQPRIFRYYFQISFQDEISNLWYFAAICSLEDLNCVNIVLYCGDWRPQYPVLWLSDSYTLTGERMAPVGRLQWRYQPPRHKTSFQDVKSTRDRVIILISSYSVEILIYRNSIALNNGTLYCCIIPYFRSRL